MRQFPFKPRSVADLELGDYWTIDLPQGGLGVLQVRDLVRTGPGARTAFVAGVIDWSGSTPPQASDLKGRRVLARAYSC
jgi:hypothetical protein